MLLQSLPPPMKYTTHIVTVVMNSSVPHFIFNIFNNSTIITIIGTNTGISGIKVTVIHHPPERFIVKFTKNIKFFLTNHPLQWMIYKKAIRNLIKNSLIFHCSICLKVTYETSVPLSVANLLKLLRIQFLKSPFIKRPINTSKKSLMKLSSDTSLKESCGIE